VLLVALNQADASAPSRSPVGRAAFAAESLRKQKKVRADDATMTQMPGMAHAGDGIWVNCVCPGFVETDMGASLASAQEALLGQSAKELTRERMRQIPLGRMERPAGVAEVIGFLVSPRAEYMKAPASSVDGGPLMHG
jgi:NAD(P)-dependent dehydrogenase (short-subunit alcohol dehydrogenase family)